MSAPEVDWVLTQLGSVVGALSVPLRRVDRDESEILETDVRSVTGDLQDANYVGATHAGRSTTPIGTEYDHQVETVVGVRVTGLHHSEYGYIDAEGGEGIPFDELVRRTQDALLGERTWPAAAPPGTTYTHLVLEDYGPRSAQYGDYYQYDYDVRFHGYETLP